MASNLAENTGNTWIRPSTEPDVTVFVGGQEYQEYSHVLCEWSDYFNSALRSNMKESRSKTFHFVDRDPKEWEWINSLVAPFSSEEMNKDNVLVALSWFDELCCAGGLQKCDLIIYDRLLPKILDQDMATRLASYNTHPSQLLTDKLIEYVEVMETGLRCGLQYTTYRSIGTLSWILEKHPTLMPKEILKRVESIMRDHYVCRHHLISSMGACIPNTTFEQQHLTVMLENGILHEIVHLGIELQRLEAVNVKLRLEATDKDHQKRCQAIVDDFERQEQKEKKKAIAKISFGVAAFIWFVSSLPPEILYI